LTFQGVAGCQPTASIYLGGWYDWLCAFSNLHTEHHDFPDVPLLRLRELRDRAAAHYDQPLLADPNAGWLPIVKRSFERRGYYACAGSMSDVLRAGEAAVLGKSEMEATGSATQLAS